MPENIHLRAISFLFSGNNLNVTKEELENLRSQFGTTDLAKTRAFPFVFTEQGVYMLATVINSPTAIDVSKNIMRTFAKLRELSKALDEMLDASKAVERRSIGFIKPKKDPQLLMKYGLPCTT